VRLMLCMLPLAALVASARPALANGASNTDATLLGWTADGLAYVVHAFQDIADEAEVTLHDLKKGTSRTICEGEGCGHVDAAKARKIPAVARLKLVGGVSKGPRGQTPKVYRRGRKLHFELRGPGKRIRLGARATGCSSEECTYTWSLKGTTWGPGRKVVLFEIQQNTAYGDLAGDTSTTRAETAVLLDLSLPEVKVRVLAKKLVAAGGDRRQQVGKTLNTRGMRLYRRKQHTRAAVAFELAHRFAPKHALAIYNRACVAGQQGQAKVALTWLEKLKRVGGKRAIKLLAGARKDKDFDRVHKDAAFARALKRLTVR